MRRAGLVAWALWVAVACGQPSEPSQPREPAITDPLVAGPAAERAMVRALLDEIAAAHGPEDIGDEEVRALWESQVAGQPLPARVPLERVEEALRAELVDRARLAALIELLSELERTHGVERNLPAIEALATLPLTFEDEP